MQYTFLDVNGVKTNVLTFGRWVQEPEAQPLESGEDIVLIIPGNPGVTGFYKMFMHTVHEKTGFPVWIIGHAGHEISKNRISNPVLPLKGNEEVFGLQGQIQHKIDFIKKYVPETARLHLIGHSIGAYIILELLKHDSIKAKVADVQLLFPTIEKMADSPNGKLFTKFLKHVIFLIVFLSWIWTLLPSLVQNALMYTYMKVCAIPPMHTRTIINFIDPSILSKVFFLAFEELDQVRNRDGETVKANSEKVRFLYGRTDGWVPTTYCDSLKKEFPEIQAQVKDLDHAFVLRQSREVGNLVADWIGERIVS